MRRKGAGRKRPGGCGVAAALRASAPFACFGGAAGDGVEGDVAGAGEAELALGAAVGADGEGEEGIRGGGDACRHN